MNLPCGEAVSIGSGQRAEEGALGLQPLDHLQQMRQRSRQAVDPHDDQRVALADPLQHPRQHRPRAIAARGLFFMDLGAARGFQGLRLGQGGLILGRYAGIADQGHQNRPFAVSYTATKRPFVNGCKGVLCGAVHQKALGFHTLSAIRELLADHRARVLYKVCRCTLTKPLGKMQKCRILHI